jgi:hypothetical protein
MRFSWFVFFMLVSSLAFAIPTGNLVFIRDGGVYVGTPNAYPKLVQKSARSSFVSLSPDGRSLVFFNQTDSKVAPLQGYISRFPFDSSAPLTLPVSEFPLESLSFSPDSSSLFVTGLSTGWRLEIPEYKALLGAPNPKATPLKFAPLSSATNGSLVAFVVGSEVRVMNKNKERMIFTPLKPEVLLEQANVVSQNLPALKEMLGSVEPPTLNNWNSGAVGLRPDGNVLYFANNLGTGFDGNGNTRFVFFAVQLSTQRIRLLSKLGVFFGTLPSRILFSPDGAKFAFYNQRNLDPKTWTKSLIVAELNLEKAIEMLIGDPPPAPVVTVTGTQISSDEPLPTQPPPTQPLLSAPTGEGLLEHGMAFSPDSKFFAFSVAKFATNNPVFKIFIKDISSNRTLLKIPNAFAPSWGAK